VSLTGSERDAVPGPPPDGPEGAGRRHGLGRLGLVRRFRRARARHPVRTFLLTALAAVLLVAVAVLAEASWQTYGVYRDLKGSMTVLQQAKSGLAAGRLPSADQFFRAAQQANDAADRMEHPGPAVRLAGLVPGVRDVVRSVQGAAGAARAEARVATDLGNLARDLVGSAPGGKGLAVYHNGAIDVGLLQGLPSRLEGLKRDLEGLRAQVRLIPTVPVFGKVAKLKQRAVRDSTAAIAVIDRGILGAKLLPGFLGANGTKTYFVAVQNNADQRATGGAVLGYAIVRFTDGKLRLLEGGGINQVDVKEGGIPVDFPPAVAWYLGQIKLAPRINNGANYTPDFPSVGWSWAHMVAKRTGMRIDGAIAIDPFAIAGALKGQGTVDVPAYPKPVDASNLVQITEHDQYTLSREAQDRLPHELIRSAFALLEHPKNFVEMAGGLADSVGGRHVQIWLADPTAQSLVAKLGWDGGLHAGAGDYLGLAYEKRIRGKQDYWTQQTITYRADVQPSGSVRSDYTVGVSDEIPAGEPGRVVPHVEPYGLTASMFNLYVPQRAVFERVTPSGPFDMSFVRPNQYLGYIHPNGFVQHTEGDFRVLTQTVTPYPGHPKSVRFEYTIPGVVQQTPAGRVYELRIMHQPLYRAAVMNVTISLPEGSHVRWASPGLTIRGTTLSMRTTLTRDLTLRIVF
jgi:hypothetical protein